MLSAGNTSCISRRSHIGLLLIHKAVQRSEAVVYRGGVFEIIIPLTMVSMTKVGPGTSPVASGEVGTQAEYASSTHAGTQAEYASSTHAENTDNNQSITISLDVNKLNELLDYCSEPRMRSEMQEFCGIKTREYFRKKILAPMVQAGKLLLTIPDKPKSPNQKYYWNK